MTIRLSTGLRNALAQGLGFAGAFNRCSINIYSGTQPVSADAAVTGTLLGTVTASSGALTQETRASGTVTLTGGASGSFASTRWTMLSTRSCSPAEMKILVPEIA